MSAEVLRNILGSKHENNGIFSLSDRAITRIMKRINNLIDPRGRATDTAGRDHCFCTYRPSVRPSVPTFENKTNLKRKTMFTFDETVGLAEWIIDDTCFGLGCFYDFRCCSGSLY